MRVLADGLKPCLVIVVVDMLLEDMGDSLPMPPAALARASTPVEDSAYGLKSCLVVVVVDMLLEEMGD